MSIEELALEVRETFGGSIKYCRGELPDDFGFSVEKMERYEQEKLFGFVKNTLATSKFSLTEEDSVLGNLTFQGQKGKYLVQTCYFGGLKKLIVSGSHF